MNKEEKNIKDEIRREFQLERIMLFTDAVFAIAMTLMAIEIRLPEKSAEPFTDQVFHLLPIILAYAASFAFIGQIWYQHLKVFGLLKDYDTGLIVRNLALLFCIGFFPFSVTLIASKENNLFFPVIIYFLVIFFCKGAQLTLQQYILVKRPNLRIKEGVYEEVVRFKKSRLAAILFVICFLLVASTMLLIGDPELKYFAWWWFFPFPFVLKYFQKKIK